MLVFGGEDFTKYSIVGIFLCSKTRQTEVWIDIGIASGFKWVFEYLNVDEAHPNSRYSFPATIQTINSDTQTIQQVNSPTISPNTNHLPYHFPICLEPT